MMKIEWATRSATHQIEFTRSLLIDRHTLLLSCCFIWLLLFTLYFIISFSMVKCYNSDRQVHTHTHCKFSSMFIIYCTSWCRFVCFPCSCLLFVVIWALDFFCSFSLFSIRLQSSVKVSNSWISFWPKVLRLLNVNEKNNNIVILPQTGTHRDMRIRGCCEHKLLYEPVLRCVFTSLCFHFGMRE